MRTVFEGSLFADYFQLVIEDAGNGDGAAEDYGEEAMHRRVTGTPHALSIFTARNMDVPVRVVWWEARPDLELSGFDHAVEASFSAPSGEVIVMGPTQPQAEARRTKVPAGPIRMLALFADLGALSEDELDGDDRYEIHLWAEARSDTIVRKQWRGR